MQALCCKPNALKAKHLCKLATTNMVLIASVVRSFFRECPEESFAFVAETAASSTLATPCRSVACRGGMASVQGCSNGISSCSRAAASQYTLHLGVDAALSPAEL